MKHLLTIIITLAILSACGSSSHQYWVVSCDSGFTTGSSHYTVITSQGIIKWRTRSKSPLRYRKITQNEICTDQKVNQPTEFHESYEQRD